MSDGERCCVVCRDVLAQRSDELDKDFAKRRTCGRAKGCSAASRRVVGEPKSCEVCGVLMARRANEGSAAFRHRRTCSRACTTILAKRVRLATGTIQEKAILTCEKCGNPFRIRRAAVINQTNGSPRRFCSRRCKYMAARKKWPLERTNLVPYTCAECGAVWHDKPSLAHRKKFCSRVCVGAATVRRLQTESPTSIEVATFHALRQLGIAFEPQARIGQFVVDAFLPDLNTIIECQGDFHHCNPARYPDGPRHAIQHKTVRRDAERQQVFAGDGYRVVYLWERDVRERGALALICEALGMRS